MKSVLFLLFTLSFSWSAVRNTYEGWKVYRIWPPSEQIVEDLGLLYDNTLNIDYWTTIRESGQPVDVAVAEIAHPSFDNILYMINITHRTEIEHLNKAFNKERNDMKKVPPVEDGQINFDTYHRYDTIISYLNNLPLKYKDLVTVSTLGTTFEKRDIKVVKISKGNNVDKPAILIDAGLSPREWIGPAQALYIINYLLQDSNNRLIENVDWYIVPLVNPDGYEYTHTVQRLWKKNRSKHAEKMYGTFINRNFDVDWGKKLSKDDPDSWNYQGEKPFSEPESLALKRLIEENSRRIQLYLSLHSFGPTILYPYGFTRDQPENIKLHKWLAEKASEAIFKNSEDIAYRTRSSSGKKYFFSGSSVDWAVNVIGIPLGYTIELPSPGFLGFDFPISKIESVVEKIIPGLVEFHDFVKTSFYNPEDVDQDGINAVVVEKNEEEEGIAEEEIVNEDVEEIEDSDVDIEMLDAHAEGNFRRASNVNDEL